MTDETADDGVSGSLESNVCRECGAFVDPTTWTPVESVRNDGDLLIYQFCSKSCQQEWQSEH